jgi:hypothetical protein
VHRERHLDEIVWQQAKLKELVLQTREKDAVYKQLVSIICYALFGEKYSVLVFNNFIQQEQHKVMLVCSRIYSLGVQILPYNQIISATR